MTVLELVTADHLRAGDNLVATGEGLLHVRDVTIGPTAVELLTGFERGTYLGPSKVWSVPRRVRFRRIRQSKRIDMRPDLKRGGAR